MGLDSPNLKLKFLNGQVMAWLIFNFFHGRIYELSPAPKLWKFPPDFAAPATAAYGISKNKKKQVFYH